MTPLSNGDILANDDAYRFDSEFVVDLETEYEINASSSLLIGVNDALYNSGQTTTEMHDLGINTATAALGNTYSAFSPMGFSGAFWYANYRYNF